MSHNSLRSKRPVTSTRTPRVRQNEHIAIAIMGPTGAGKSTFINLISGSQLDVGHGQKSCTTTVETSLTFTLFDRDITLIDTPGFDDTTRSDTDVLKMIALYLSTTYEKGYTLSGIIYLHRISDVRMGGIARRNFNLFRNLCGDETLKNVVIVTNMWGSVDLETGRAREHELATDDLLFKLVLDKGAAMVRHDNTIESAQAIVSHFVNNRPKALRIQEELIDEHKDILQTAAGAELNRELMELEEKHRAEIQEVQKEMREALLAKDMETRQELDEVRVQLEGNMKKIQSDRERLSSEYAEEKRLADQKMEEMMNRLKAEEAAREQRTREIERLQETMRQANSQSAAERQSTLDQINRLQQQQINRLQQQQKKSGGFFGAIGRALDSLFGW